jgi:hypothetical protein
VTSAYELVTGTSPLSGDDASRAWAAVGLIPYAKNLKYFGRIAEAAKETSTVIGRLKDLKSLRAGEKTLLDRLPSLGTSKANWQQNAGVFA